MSSTVTTPQKRILERLLKTGRWNNKSEIVRHGLELVRREVEREELAPMPDEVLAEAYRQITPQELAEERAMGRACARPKAGELSC